MMSTPQVGDEIILNNGISSGPWGERLHVSQVFKNGTLVAKSINARHHVPVDGVTVLTGSRKQRDDLIRERKREWTRKWAK